MVGATEAAEKTAGLEVEVLVDKVLEEFAVIAESESHGIAD